MDEYAIGFGYTGAMSAFTHCKTYQKEMEIPKKFQFDVCLDIVCIGKALTSGYISLSALITTAKTVMKISVHGESHEWTYLYGKSARICVVRYPLTGDWISLVQHIESD